MIVDRETGTYNYERVEKVTSTQKLLAAGLLGILARGAIIGGRVAYRSYGEGIPTRAVGGPEGFKRMWTKFKEGPVEKSYSAGVQHPVFGLASSAASVGGGYFALEELLQKENPEVWKVALGAAFFMNPIVATKIWT